MAEHEEKPGQASAALLSKIPAFPPIAMKVASMAADDAVAVRDLVEILTVDPVFSAQILRVANSPLFAFRAQIDSLQHALVVLGIKRVQTLAMTIATRSYMRTGARMDIVRRCWRHTLACALLSQELARACGLPEDRGYTAGLLHDLGRLGLLVGYPEQYAIILDKADRAPQALLDLEKSLFGLDHCDAGRWLADKWNLPDEVRMIAGRHHDQPSGSQLDMLGVVYWGCLLADALGFDVVTPLQPPDLEAIGAALPPAARSHLPNDLNALRESIEKKIVEHDTLGQIEAPPELPASPTPSVEPSSQAPPVEAGETSGPVSEKSADDSYTHIFLVVGLTSLIVAALAFGLLFLVGR